jgi:hypothetical protein
MEQVLEKSVLDTVVHARLIDNLDSIAHTAKVPVHMLHKSAKTYLNKGEVDWLARFRAHKASGKAGLCLMGEGQNAEVKMMAMAAALIRNFIDARVVTLGSMRNEAGEFAPPNPSVLLVPTFCVSFDGKPLATWQVQELYSMLVDRMAAGKMTVLYVVNWKMLRAQFGPTVTEFVQNNFTVLGE